MNWQQVNILISPSSMSHMISGMVFNLYPSMDLSRRSNCHDTQLVTILTPLVALLYCRDNSEVGHLPFNNYLTRYSQYSDSYDLKSNAQNFEYVKNFCATDFVHIIVHNHCNQFHIALMIFLRFQHYFLRIVIMCGWGLRS